MSHNRTDSTFNGEKDSALLSPKRTSQSTATTSTKRKLPPFLDHFNARDLKRLFRCSVALWICSLFIFIGPTLRGLGSATFFACIITLFVPPEGVVFVFIIGRITAIIGMCIGWAWGCIVMKAALATRPQHELRAKEALLQQKAATLGHTAFPATEVLTYEGFFLDTRVSVTYFCMIGLLAYMLARLEKKAPNLILVTVFGWIVSDIYLTIAPLLPAFNGTIALTFIKPAATSIAVSLTCAVLIFPESTSHLAMYEMHKLVTAMKGSLDLAANFLASFPDTSHMGQMQTLRAAILGSWEPLEPALSFLSFDFSMGYWNTQDITSLREPLRQILLSTLSLLDFQILQNKALEKTTDKSHEKKHSKHQVMQSLNLLESMQQHDVGQSISDSYQTLSQSSDPLMQACKDGFQAIMHSLHENNSRRWFGKMSAEDVGRMRQEHMDVLERLREEKAKFPKVANDALLSSHDHLFDAAGKFRDNELSRHKLVGLFFGFNFEDRLVLLASSLERALDLVTLVENERTTSRLWLPSGLDKFANWAFGKSRIPVVQTPTASIPEADKAAIAEMKERIRPMHKPLRRRNKFSTIVLAIGHWLSNDDGIFAFRILLATIATGVPAVCKSSAGFYYREKGIWALIMAQTAMGTFSSEFNYAFVTRMLSTIGGGLLGMVAWYIGSGHGTGNPYGLGAIMAVVSVILMWLRLHLSHHQIGIAVMSGATASLVVGYSYTDTHLPEYGSPGYGWEVFWKRTVLVIVGFAAGWLVSLLPWPKSQSRAVASTLSGVIHDEADHYAALLTSWRDIDTHVNLMSAVEASCLNVSERLSALHDPISDLKFEFSSSAFDSLTCTRISELAETANVSLAHLHFRAAQLPARLRERFAMASGFMDHRSIADVMSVLGIVSQNLKTGDALPTRLPTPLLKKCLEYSHGVDVSSLTREELRDEDHRGFCVCMSAYFSFLSAIDELVLVLKEALGETHYVPEDLS